MRNNSLLIPISSWAYSIDCFNKSNVRRLELNIDIIILIASVPWLTSNDYNLNPPKKNWTFNNAYRIFLLICNNERSFL